MTPPTAPLVDEDRSAEPTAAVDATDGGDRKKGGEQIALFLFIAVPFVALVAALPIAWGGGLGRDAVVIATVMYVIAGHGIGVGFHRYFTHGSFKARRPLRIALAVAGSAVGQGAGR